ncbi:MAG: type II secretion system protein GspG [Candidatus Aureabacteria bacterium]|nr:type II secretion system protein GspG [Candidatus Auribacterota bacterium]
MKESKKNGFTLIEILVVVGIILILSSVGLSIASSVTTRGKKSNSRSDIARLEMAVQSYANDFNAYPPNITNAQLVNLLTNTAVFINNPRWQGPYLQFDENDIVGGQFVDGWKNPYQYRTGGNNSTFCDIYSFGEDEVNNNGAGDDINNWTRQ